MPLRGLETKAKESHLHTLYFLSQGFHTEKTGATKEGCALFVRSSQWRLAARKEISLSMTRKEAAGVSAELSKLLADEPDTAEALESVTTCAQLAFLVPVVAEGQPWGSRRPLVVGNTHLFFHPQAAHIRLIQAHTLLSAAAAFSAEQHRQRRQQQEHGGEPEPEPGFVLCGDRKSVV